MLEIPSGLLAVVYGAKFPLNSYATKYTMYSSVREELLAVLVMNHGLQCWKTFLSIHNQTSITNILKGFTFFIGITTINTIWISEGCFVYIKIPIKLSQRIILKIQHNDVNLLY